LAPPIEVPKPLAELFADPTLVRSLPKPLCVQVLAVMLARLLEPVPAPEPAPPDEPPIGRAEAGRRLGYRPGTGKKICNQDRFKKFRLPSATCRSRWSPAAIREHVNGTA